MRGKGWLSPVCLLLLCLAPALSRAAELRVQSSTQYLWYTDPFQNDDQSDLVQYLKLGAPAIDNAGRVSAHAYGRVSKQFGGDDTRGLGNNEDLLGRLYFLYVDYALPADRGALRVGRQYVAVGAGAGTVDGVSAVARPYGPLTLAAFAGYDVRFAQTTDVSKSGNYLAGVSAGGAFLKGNRVDLSYLRKYDDDDVIREMLGLHTDQRILGKAKGYVDWRYDVLHGSNAEFLAGAKVFAFPGLVTVTGEYYESYPTFDADTIYTVFAVTRYRETLGRIDYIASDRLTLFGSYAHADYDGPSADVAAVGFRARPKQVERLGVAGSIDVRSGYPGDLTGFRLSADYALGKSTLAAGLTYDAFERDAMTDDFQAKKYWAAGSYDFRGNMTARLRLEDTVTRQFENEFQGRASVDVRF